MNTPTQYKQVATALQSDFYTPGTGADAFAGALLARCLLSRKRYEVAWVDSGSDLSSYPRATHQAFQPDAYSTVEAFLNEPSGETAATFVSGAGLAAETLEEAFERALTDEEMRFARAHYTPVDEEDFEGLVETLSEDEKLTEARYSWLETFLARPLGEVVTPYWAQARDQLTLEDARAQAAARLATARRAHQEALGARASARLERAGIRTEAHYDMTKRQHIEALTRQLEALGADGPSSTPLSSPSCQGDSATSSPPYLKSVTQSYQTDADHK